MRKQETSYLLELRVYTEPAGQIHGIAAELCPSPSCSVIPLSFSHLGVLKLIDIQPCLEKGGKLEWDVHLCVCVFKMGGWTKVWV